MGRSGWLDGWAMRDRDYYDTPCCPLSFSHRTIQSILIIYNAYVDIHLQPFRHLAHGTAAEFERP